MPKDDRHYINVSVDLPGHPKLVGAPAATKWLDVCGWIVAGRDLLDGIIRPQVAIAEAEVPKRHATDLIARGRWHEPGHDCTDCPQPPVGHIAIHHYLEHNRSRAEAEESRRKKSAAGTKGAQSRWGDSNRHSASHSNRDNRRSGKTMAESESEKESVVTSNSQSSTHRLDHDGLTKIMALTKGSERHAERTAETILTRATVEVLNPTRYVLAAIEAEPELYRYRRGNPTKATACHDHPGEWADACRIHTAEYQAQVRSLQDARRNEETP